MNAVCSRVMPGHSAREFTHISDLRLALAAFLALAVAMGIGRFAFTPLLPLMMADGLSIGEGGWLATANYAGYLLGAMSAARVTQLRPTTLVRLALVLIAALTALTGCTSEFAAWAVLRALAGVASAFVMVHGSAWALRELAQRARPDLAVRLYGGVGTGIAITGLLVLATASQGGGGRIGWLLCGLLAAVLGALAWGGISARDEPAAHAPADGPASADGLRLVWCYGAYGLGYIIPATFLPALARQYFPDSAVFGWVWPVFGLAALVSTQLAAGIQLRSTPRRVWTCSHAILAAGVAVLLAPPGIGTILFSAICVGGAFMVPTLSGFQLARQISGGQPTRLIGAMTAAFAFGQIAGPLLLSWADRHGLTAWALVGATASLVASGVALWRMPEPRV